MSSFVASLQKKLINNSLTTTILVVVFVSFIVRFIYGQIQPQMILTADSSIYYDLATKMFSEPSVKLVINPFKTPLYGLSIYTVMKLFGDQPGLIGSSEFMRTTRHLMLVQQLLSIVGVIILFKLTILITKSRNLSFMVALFHGVNLLNLPWERSMLTESLGTLWVITYTYLLVLILQKPRFRYFFCLFLISVLGFLLRPALILIPVLGPIFISVIIKKSQIIKFSAVLLFLYLSVIWIFIRLNNLNWQYRGIQITGDINLLGKVLQYNLPIESVKDQAYFYNLVRNYRARRLPLHPYRLLDYFDPGIYLNFPKLQILRQFSSRVVADNFIVYLYRSILLLPQALSQTDQTIAVNDRATGLKPIALLLSFGQYLYGLIQLTGLMIFVVLPFGFYQLFTNRLSVNESLVTVIAFLATQQILLSVLLSYEEYGRLITVVSPLIILTLCYWFRKVMVKLGK